MTPIEALNKFHAEQMRFLGARVYLQRIHIEALKNNPTIAEAHESFEKLLEGSESSPHDFITARLFISLVAAFELFLQDLIAYVVRKHPKKVGSASFQLAEIIDAASTDQLVDRAIEEHLNRLMYKRPTEYLSEVSELLSIEPNVLEASWPAFVEAKARRDLAVHNGWVCNSTYLRKLREAGISATLAIGQSALPRGDDYFLETPNSIYRLASAATSAVIRKHGGEA